MADGAAEAEKHLRIPITVNKEHFEWDRETITGLEVLDLAHEKPDEYVVYIKRTGQDDRVEPNQSVDIQKENNRHFRTVPKHTTEG